MSKQNTVFTGGPIKIVGTLPPPGSPGAVQPVLPFAAIPYPIVSRPDSVLQTALNDATAAQAAASQFGPNSHIAFSLIALATEGHHHRYAGVFHDEMHFSASLVKVAAMYAAHELLAAARRLAEKGFSDRTAFFAELSTKFDSRIGAVAVPSIRNLVVDNALMGPAPKYDLIFSVTNLGVANEPPVVDFLPQFQKDLNSMIAHGTNTGAAACIRKLSYRYINAALIKGGFFTPMIITPPSPENGIWLAGDYFGDKNSPKFNNPSHIPYVRIDCDNDCKIENGIQDCKVAQITTTRQMSNLFALIELGKLPNGDSDANAKMKSLLSEPKPIIPGTEGERDTPWVKQSRLHGVTARFKVTHDKIGVADLKRGPSVHSEGLIVEWIRRPEDTQLLNNRKLSGKIAVCWQNLVGPPPGIDFNGIARVINDTFEKYISTPI